MNDTLPHQRVAIALGSFTIDLERSDLFDAQGQRVPLRRQALAVLLELAQHARLVLSRDALMQAVWKEDPQPLVEQARQDEIGYLLVDALEARAEWLCARRDGFGAAHRHHRTSARLSPSGCTAGARRRCISLARR